LNPTLQFYRYSDEEDVTSMGSVVTELMGSDVEGHIFHLRGLTPGEVAEDEEISVAVLQH
jgi:hypothetical protein